MPRLARAEIFSHDLVATVHVMARVVRRCYLLGTDSVTGKNYDHRKVWIEEQLIRLTADFGIDLLCFSILSNHFHLVLRSRPDVVANWNDTDSRCPGRDHWSCSQAPAWERGPRSSASTRCVCCNATPCSYFAATLPDFSTGTGAGS